MLSPNRHQGRAQQRTKVKRVGSGAFGYVDLMSDGTVDKHMQARTDQQREIFLREAELLKAASPHPNIVRYINHFVRGNGEGVLTIEYMEGNTVNAWVKEHREMGRLRRELWFPFTQTLLNAINYLHRKGFYQGFGAPKLNP